MTSDKERAIIRDYLAKTGMNRLAVRYNCKPTTIRAILEHHNITINPQYGPIRDAKPPQPKRGRGIQPCVVSESKEPHAPIKPFS